MEGLPAPTPKNVADLRAVYLTEFGGALSFDEARDAMTKLMRFVYVRDELLAREDHCEGAR